jgi:hypothetical protein
MKAELAPAIRRPVGVDAGHFEIIGMPLSKGLFIKPDDVLAEVSCQRSDWKRVEHTAANRTSTALLPDVLERVFSGDD